MDLPRSQTARVVPTRCFLDRKGGVKGRATQVCGSYSRLFPKETDDLMTIF